MYRAPKSMHSPQTNTPTEPPLRSAGPLGEPIHGLRMYDPVQIGWLSAETRDDLDPEAADPFAPGADSAAARGLELRHWRQHDVAQYLRLLDDPLVWAHLPEPYPNPLGTEQARDLIAASNMHDHHDVRAVVFAGQPIGQIRLHHAPGDTAHHDAELSYWLGRSYWNRGFATALVTGAVRRIHDNAPELLRLIAKVRPDNPASRRVLEKAGFAPIAAPARGGFKNWCWFGLRRQRMTRMFAQAR